MKGRYLLVATLVGGLVLFAWGAIANATGILKALEPHTFTAPDTVVATIKANAPVNGVYFDDRGVFAAVALKRDLTPRYASLVVPLVTQLLIELAVAFLLAWILLRLPIWSPFGTGSIFAAFGLAAGVALLLSGANWYGLPLPYQLANLADLVIGWFLAGIVIGAFRRKWMAA